MKKLFISTAIVALTAILFTACQPGNQSESATETPVEANTTDSIVSPEDNLTVEEAVPAEQTVADEKEKTAEPTAQADAKQDAKPAEIGNKVGTTYKVTLSPDVMRVCDVYANYRNAEGKEVSEKIGAATWIKRITPKETPLQRGISCSFKVKNNLPAGEQNYNFKCEVKTYDDVTGYKYQYMGTPVNTKGEVKMTPDEVKKFFAEKSNKSDDPGKTSSYGFIIERRGGDPDQVWINWAPQLAPNLVK